jgi:transcription elongation factor GreA
MYNELTENDIKKMEKEIEYRTLVVRKEALEDVKTARANKRHRHRYNREYS